ncbi:DUF6443 domain-containing protein [Ekhidna sp. To15]|uniref:DUF6443 domain-containing protein n=1 Tax=Ekhidna sp. To15 TaxID=3395267 RepID=UPI003F527745
MSNSLQSSKKLFFIIAACLFAFNSFSQEYYVKNKTLSSATGNEGKTYNYTGTVKLTNGFVASGANGTFIIKPIPINPPPSPTENYVRVEVPKAPVSDEETLTLMGPDDKSVSYSYSDGLGRTLMTTSAAAGPEYEDVVQIAYYDNIGRQSRTYLPYVKKYNESGSYQANGETQTIGFYSNPPTGVIEDDSPYSYRSFDARGRVEYEVAPGDNWHTAAPETAKQTKYDYFIHNPSESTPSIDFPVAHWKITNGVPVNDRNYGEKELLISEVTDPHQKKARTVTDMRGLTITTQVYDVGAQKWYGSYNVYDDFGRIRFIIPPKLTLNITAGALLPSLTTTQIDELLFEYKYDARGRVTKKRSPGAGWTYYVYDDWDRLVMMRHDSQKFDGANSWTFYKYDAFNRQVMSGEIKTNDDRQTIQDKVDGHDRFETENTNQYGYSIAKSFPRLGSDPTTKDYTNYEIRTVNYFDDYSFKTNTNWDTDLAANAFDLALPSGFTGTQLSNALNLPTGSKVLVLDSNPKVWLSTVVYYDSDRRVLQAISENHLGGSDRMTNQLDWKGELEKMLLEHTSTTDNVDVLNEYEYAHNGQLLKTYQTTDNGDRVIIGDYHYNTLGELIEKNLHSLDGSTYLQSVDYSYNIQRSLKAINDTDLGDGEGDVFGMKYHYETPVSINSNNTQKRFDGLTGAVTWNATNITPSVAPTKGPNGQTTKAIGYTYDSQNRLKSTSYGEGAGSTFNQKTGHFDMSATYDANGNIDDLTRKSKNQSIDVLDYTYEDNSNKLKKVDDTAPYDGGLDDYYTGPTDYKYDAMGNMEEDMNKQITAIEYNHLQLVDRFEFFDGTEIKYVYDAVGNRIAKTINDSDGNALAKVDYIGSIEYLNDQVNQLFTAEGRAYVQNNEYHYEYFITDQQANTRVAFGDLPERNVYLATMESGKSSYEESEFAFPANIRSGTENHTPLGAESVILNGTANGEEVGPAKVLTIATGDEVDIEVWAKYTDAGWNNSSIADIVSVLTTAFGTTSAGTGAEGASTSYIDALNLGSLGVYGGNTSGQPEAYLQYMFFDANHNYVSDITVSNYRPVGNESNGSFAKLSSGTLTFNEPGYLLVYVVNESDQDKEVYFDDLKITHSSTTSAFRVTQVNDYYPFGLPTADSWKASGYIDPGLLYQSAFSTLDSLTGYYDFLSRNYDPALGRFFAVDPAGQFNSPYVGMGNVPHMGVDPNGESLIPIAVNIGLGFLFNTAVNGVRAAVNSFNGNGSFWENMSQFGYGSSVTYNTGSGYKLNQSNGFGAGTQSNENGPQVWGGFANPETIVSEFNFDTEVTNVKAIGNEWSADISSVKWQLINGKLSRAKRSIGKRMPVALMYGLDGDFVVGAGTELTIGGAIILRGPDAGKVVGFLDGTGAGPTAGGGDASASIEGMYVFYSGNVENFNASMLEGYRTEVSGSFSAVVDFGVNSFWARDVNPIDGGRVYGFGGSFGIGWPVFNSVINGNTNYGQTIIFGNE